MSAALAGLNFRDVGGVPVRGGAVRHGLLYRCEGPGSFTDAQHIGLAALGIELVVDLRSEIEHVRAAGNRAWGRRVILCDIAADFRTGGVDWLSLGPAPSAALVRERMIATYAAMPAALAPHMGVLVGAMAGGALPALIHCTAGKDRTGALVALLLRLLGADEVAVLADYAGSAPFGRDPANRARVRRQLARAVGQDFDDGALDAVIGVDPAYLAAALAAAEAAGGSIAGWFAAAGVGADVVRRLRARLIAPVED